MTNMELSSRAAPVRPDALARKRAPASAEAAIQQESKGSMAELLSSRSRVLFDAFAAAPTVQRGVTLLAHALPPPRVTVTYHDVSVPRLPPHLNGLRVMHVSDLHLHPGSELALQIPALIDGIPHDLLCYTGDFIDTDNDLPQVASLLSRMPRHTASYAVLGNHDYRPYGGNRGSNDVARLRQILATSGIQVLDNAATSACGGRLFVAGVDDPATGRDRLDRAVAQISADACFLLLAHSPDIVFRLGSVRPDLILSGHTHGGQIRLPFVGAVRTEIRLPRRFAMGLHRYQGTPLFVTRGIGYSGIDLRISCPPEVAVLTLRSAP